MSLMSRASFENVNITEADIGPGAGTLHRLSSILRGRPARDFSRETWANPKTMF
jgi:hypothetical protein